MKTYRVTLKRTLFYSVYVEAENKSKAEDQALFEVEENGEEPLNTKEEAKIVTVEDDEGNEVED
jgi:hypothetical protein